MSNLWFIVWTLSLSAVQILGVGLQALIIYKSWLRMKSIREHEEKTARLLEEGRVLLSKMRGEDHENHPVTH